MRRVQLTFALLMTVSATLASAQQPAAPAPIELVQLSPQLYRASVDTDFVPSNLVASVGEDGILVVDPGGAQTAGALAVTLERLPAGPARIVVDTHGHTDHTAGNGLWGERGVVIAQAEVRRELSSGPTLLLDLPSDALPTITFSDRLTLHFNGEEIRLEHMPGSHSPSDTVVTFVGAKLVCLGGLVYADQFPYLSVRRGGTPDGLVRNLDAILAAAPAGATFVPGHGRDLGAADLQAYRAMVLETQSVIEKAIAAGQDAAALKDSGALAAWKPWERPFLDTGGWVDMLIAARNPPPADDRPSVIDALYPSLKSGDVTAALARYRELKRGAAADYAFTEGALNAVGYYLLGKGRFDDAIAVFELNVEEYPQGFNTYDSLAEGHMKRGDREQAIRFYRMSLELNPANQNAVAKLKELGAS